MLNRDIPRCMVSIYYSIILFKLFKLNLMKKTYNVYSFLEKTRVTTGFRSIAMMFVFIVCFLSYSSDASAQTFNTNPNTGARNGANATINASIIKEYTFTQDEETALGILRQEAKSLADAPFTNGAVAESTFASKKHFLDTAISSLSDGRDVSTSLLDAYQGTANYVESTFSIGIDAEGILRTYAGLLQ